MGYLVTQIRVGDNKVGITGLEEIFRDLQAGEITDDEALADEILTRAKVRNYIPSGLEADYRHAMFQEFRRYRGEQVVEDQQAPEIRVYGGD